jgi:hypothetical protein
MVHQLMTHEQQQLQHTSRLDSKDMSAKPHCISWVADSIFQWQVLHCCSQLHDNIACLTNGDQNTSMD